MPGHESPAEIASREALEQMYSCLDGGKSFRLEAGAGAGKTFSLIKALQYLIEKNKRTLPRKNQRIACITFTNVAKDQIDAKIDKSPLIYCDTNHAFCWSLIQGFQKQLRELVAALPLWQERLTEVGGIGTRAVEYSLGHRSVRERQVSLHHDDVLLLTISLMESAKFCRLMTDRFPIILIDEYQDTDAGWVEAIKKNFLGKAASPLFGFFGDHWQKIYGGGCGSLEHAAILEIGKKANFRSVKTIVDCLNRMRPELPQFVKDPEQEGEVRVIHTNGWSGARQTGNHWGGDLPSDVGHTLLEGLKKDLVQKGWDFGSEHTKILMLTHRLLASEQGYSSLPVTFQYNEAFTKKEHPLIAYLVDVLEPACEAFEGQRYGDMFSALGGQVPFLTKAAEKAQWSDSMVKLHALRASGAVGDVVEHLLSTRRPRLPDALVDKDQQAKTFKPAEGEEIPRSIVEWRKFREVAYAEVQALRKYLAGYSPFETKHGVKGAEFENVLVVIGRGWNQYNFGEMLELAASGSVPAAKAAMFERNRNLFYVACSRPKRRLALLFTQRLSDPALNMLRSWFGSDAIEAATF
jgi:DNA helicase-2/ATP-dependent DNA helicase PcrA